MWKVPNMAGDGLINPTELYATLRNRADIDAVLLPGAAGPITLVAANEIRLRAAADMSTIRRRPPSCALPACNVCCGGLHSGLLRPRWRRISPRPPTSSQRLAASRS